MSAPELPFRVLFVCTGNTCRSPLAAVALRRALGEIAPRVEVRSAGTAAWDGAPASEGARAAAQRAGLDLTSHQSRRLTADLLSEADLVLLMDPADRGRAARLDPESASNTYGLADFGRKTPRGEMVPDPFGGSSEAYDECLARIESHLERVVPYIHAELRAREESARPAS